MEIWKKGSGESIVFIHGLVGNHQAFSNEFEVFSREYQVIMYDYLGHGQDRGQAVRFTIDKLVQQLESVFHQAGIECAHLCSLSFGSFIANHFAYRHPDKVLSLCHVGGHFDNPSKLRDLLLTLWKMRDLPYEKWVEKYANDGNPLYPELPLEMIQKSRDIFFTYGMQIHPSVLISAVEQSLFSCTHEILSEIKLPALWITGQYDFLYKSCLYDLQQIMPSAQYREIPGVGHVAHIIDPKAFEALYQDFLHAVKEQNTVQAS